MILLKVTRDATLPATERRGEDALKLDVVNNYFSFGVCAQTALQAGLFIRFRYWVWLTYSTVLPPWQ